MPETPFPLFHGTYPPSPTRVPYAPDRHDALAARVPPALANEWRNWGFGGYGGGLLWTPVPDEPFLDPDAWPKLDGTGIEVLRTAFADVCLWQGGEFLWQMVHNGKTFTGAPNAEVMFEFTLLEDNLRKDGLLERLFTKARKRFGELAPDECYGFAPMPALGGAMSEKYLIKTKMRPYVAMAAQVLG